ncbi:sensor histidine kinase [Pseudarthrobacter oxydans]|uniref:sensor histidine kinase n=1 Tax=Pseudarthrobacter oxydans TaxID=1671 RepID=UPI0037F7CB22
MTPDKPDRDTLRRAALKVAVRISAACAVLVLCLLAAATAYLMYKLAHPSMPSAGSGKAYTYLDSRDLIEGMIVAGLGGVILAGVVGWLSARSAIRPLGEALALQRRFVQDASHELRTPLTILDTRIQLAQRRASPDSATGQDLARIREDAAALTGIVDELLLAATGAAPSTAAPVDVAEAAESVTEGLQELAARQGVDLAFSASGLPLARINPNSLRRAILALADNALAHTRAGGSITISAGTEGSAAVIRVADTGSGITGVDLDRIFERFVRTSGTDEAAARRSFGIGLALVREIAAAAGGTVEVARTGPEGTTMRLVLPLARH